MSEVAAGLAGRVSVLTLIAAMPVLSGAVALRELTGTSRSSIPARPTTHSAGTCCASTVESVVLNTA